MKDGHKILYKAVRFWPLLESLCKIHVHPFLDSRGLSPWSVQGHMMASRGSLACARAILWALLSSVIGTLDWDPGRRTDPWSIFQSLPQELRSSIPRAFKRPKGGRIYLGITCIVGARGITPPLLEASFRMSRLLQI